MLDALLVLFAAVLILTPCVVVVSKCTTCRRVLWRAGYSNWTTCCDRLFGDELTQQLEGERRHQGLPTVYARMPDQKPPSKGLVLAAWRSSVAVEGRACAPLERIQVKTETIERGDDMCTSAREELANGR